MKGKDHIANTNEVPVFKQRSALDHVLVHEGAVAAIEVFDGKPRTIADYLAVVPADRTDIDLNIAIGMPTKDRFGTVEFISRTGLRAIIYSEKGHPTTILGVT